MQPTYIVKSAITAGTTASAGEEEKDLKHDEDVTGAGGSFCPLVVQSFSVWTPSSLQSLKLVVPKTTIKSTDFSTSLD